MATVRYYYGESVKFKNPNAEERDIIAFYGTDIFQVVGYTKEEGGYCYYVSPAKTPIMVYLPYLTVIAPIKVDGSRLNKV